MGIVHFSNVSAKTWNGIDMTKLRFFVNQTLHPRHQKQDKNLYLNIMLSIVGGLHEGASAVCFLRLNISSTSTHPSNFISARHVIH